MKSGKEQSFGFGFVLAFLVERVFGVLQLWHYTTSAAGRDENVRDALRARGAQRALGARSEVQQAVSASPGAVRARRL